LKLDEYGKYKATLDPAVDIQSIDAKVQSVCPFSNECLNEDQIGKKLFETHGKYKEKLGYIITTYAGHVSEGEFRENGSSGGMGTWIIAELLKQKLIDAVIHVHARRPTGEDHRIFHYQVSTSIEQICNGAKSRYYPIEMSEVLGIVRKQPGRYAIVGIPCFIKAVRLLMLQDPVIGERIHFCVGIVCGHLKSTRFAEMFAWQCGIKPNELVTIDFRKKLPGLPADQYGIEAVGEKNGKIVTCSSPVDKLYGHDWGMGFFKYNACDYCDDVVAETADVSVGDAWLPQYVKNEKGDNIVVTRNPIINNLIEHAIKEGRLSLNRIDPNDVIRSQLSGFRHRHDGLAARLYFADREGKWRPEKRIRPNSYRFNPIFKRIHKLRIRMAEESHIAFREAMLKDNFSIFTRKMNRIVRQYRMTQLGPFIYRRITGEKVAIKDTTNVVSILNHVDSLNLGDACLLYMTVAMIRKSLSSSKIFVFSFDPENDKNIIHLLERDAVDFIPSVARTSKGDKATIVSDMILFLLWALIFRLSSRDLSFIIRRNKAASRALRDSELVIVRGGDNLADIYGASSFLSHTYNILLAIMLRKKIAILGTSIGPFKRNISRKFVIYLLRKVDHIVVRDSKSMSVLQNAKLDPGKIHFIPDIAFDLPMERDKNYDLLFSDQNVKYVGVATSAIIANHIGSEYYINLMANVCDMIKDKFSSNIIFISHVLSSTSNDEDLARAILAKMRNKDYAFIVHEVNPLKIRYIISKLELLISPRMHPIIHALSTGVPVIGIDYNDKTREVMRLFEKERWVTDLNHLDALVEIIDTFFAMKKSDPSFYKIDRINVSEQYNTLIRSIQYS
jgi:coenzyme F420 hydrogenase subunit beta